MRSAIVRISAVFTFAAVVLAIAAIPAQATFPGKNGKIAFQRQGPTSDQNPLYVVNPDGTGETQLASQGNSPTWSASGTLLAFECQGAICISDSSGNLIARHYVVPSGEYENYPTWAPDGARLAFDVTVPVHFGPPPEIWKMNADGTGATRIISGGAIPDWSPDGSKIAFQLSGIKVMNADGSGVTQLTGQGNYASWSPDGTKIAFDNGAGDIYTINPDGSGLTQITSGPDPEGEPVWSPDGQKIAFQKSNLSGTQYGVYVMNSDGTSPALVADKGFLPDWQPLAGPQRGDYKNSAKFCKAERDFLGDEAFTDKYGGGSSAYGRCVSQSH